MTAYPIPEAVTQHHTAVLGKTGSGKSSTGKFMIEHVVEQGFRVCILDPIKSDWWGMIGEGAGPGLPFRILGGPHGHVPLPSTAGEAVGKLVASGQLPLSIIDMADFEAGGLQRFFVDFATALMRSQKGVLYLVMEEAHEFAPKERVGVGGENLALHQAKKLATAGRSKGVRLVVLTQRVQSLHNAVLGSCESMIAHRLQTPADQKPVIDWVKANVPDKDVQREVAESLASLPTGTGWVCSGEAQVFERIAFPKFVTFDNAATPIADDEEITVKTAKVDTAALRSIIGDAVAEAEAKDPRHLQAEVARLTRELAAKPKAAPEWPDQRDEVEQLRGEVAAAGELTYQLQLRIREAATLLGAPLGTSSDACRLTENPTREIAEGVPTPKLPPQPTPQVRVRPGADHAVQSDRSVPPGTRPTLAVLASVYPAGMTSGQIAARVGIKKKGSTFSAYKSRLRTAGLIEERDGLIFASAAGAAAIGEVAPLPAPGPELARSWAAKLPGTGPVVEHLLERHPAWCERDDIAAALGINPSGSTLSAYVSRLFTAGVIEKSGSGIRLSSEVMGE